MKKWTRLDGTRIEKPVEEELALILAKETALGHELRVCIGTDSQVKAKYTEFATVIVFLRKRKGGFMLIHRQLSKRKMSIRERMLVEVAKSIEVAYPLCGLFSRYHVELELHADINSNPAFKSQTALKEAMGYILGMGFVFKSKPDAFASSSCANKMVQ